MGLTASCSNLPDTSVKCEVHSVSPGTCMVSNGARLTNLVNFTLPLIVSKSNLDSFICADLNIIHGGQFALAHATERFPYSSLVTNDNASSMCKVLNCAGTLLV